MCENYKVGEVFEFSREELEVKNELRWTYAYILYIKSFRLEGFSLCIYSLSPLFLRKVRKRTPLAEPLMWYFVERFLAGDAYKRDQAFWNSCENSHWQEQQIGCIVEQRWTHRCHSGCVWHTFNVRKQWWKAHCTGNKVGMAPHPSNPLILS